MYSPTMSSGSLGIGYNARDGFDTLSNRLLSVINNKEANFGLLEPFLPPDPPSLSGTDVMFRRLLECLPQGGIPDDPSRYRDSMPRPRNGCILNEPATDKNVTWTTLNRDYLRVIDMLKEDPDVVSAITTCQEEILTDGIDIRIKQRPIKPRYKSILTNKLVQFVSGADTNRNAYGFAIIGVKDRDNDHFGNPYSVDPYEFVFQCHTNVRTKQKQWRLLQPVLFATYDTSQYQLISIQDLRAGLYNDIMIHPEYHTQRVGFIIERDHVVFWDSMPSANGCVQSRLSRLIVPWCQYTLNRLAYCTVTKFNANRPVMATYRSVTNRDGFTSGGALSGQQNILTQKYIESTLQGRPTQSSAFIDTAASGKAAAPSALEAAESIERTRYSNSAIARQLNMDRYRNADTATMELSASPVIINAIHNNPQRVRDLFGWTDEEMQFLVAGAETGRLLEQRSLDSRRHPVLGKDFIYLGRDQTLVDIPLDREPSFYQAENAEWKDQIGRVIGVPDFVSRGQLTSNRSTQSELIQGYKRRLVPRAEIMMVMLQLAVLNTWGSQDILQLESLCDPLPPAVQPTSVSPQKTLPSNTSKKMEKKSKPKSVPLPAAHAPAHSAHAHVPAHSAHAHAPAHSAHVVHASMNTTELTDPLPGMESYLETTEDLPNDHGQDSTQPNDGQAIQSNYDVQTQLNDVQGSVQPNYGAPLQSWTKTVQVVGTSVDPLTFAPINSTVHTFQQTIHTPEVRFPPQDVRAGNERADTEWGIEGYDTEDDDVKRDIAQDIARPVVHSGGATTVSPRENKTEEVPSEDKNDAQEETETTEGKEEETEETTEEKETPKPTKKRKRKNLIMVPILFNTGAPQKVLPTMIPHALPPRPFVHPTNLILSHQQAMSRPGPIHPIPSFAEDMATTSAHSTPNTDAIDITLRFVTLARGEMQAEAAPAPPEPEGKQKEQEEEEQEEGEEEEEEPKQEKQEEESDEEISVIQSHVRKKKKRKTPSQDPIPNFMSKLAQMFDALEPKKRKR